jgi:glycine cleavage system aminomethyltransferase T
MVEAGFILQGVDYYSATRCPIESRKSSPFEIGLGWTVDLDRDPFLGQEALSASDFKVLRADMRPSWPFICRYEILRGSAIFTP